MNHRGIFGELWIESAETSGDSADTGEAVMSDAEEGADAERDSDAEEGAEEGTDAGGSAIVLD